MTRPLLHISLSCVFISSQMVPTTLKPKEIHSFTQGNTAFNLVASVTCGRVGEPE